MWSYSSKKDSWEGVKDIKDMTSREVTLTCTTDMATEFHIHPELVIMMNGQEVLVPQDLGVTPKCMTAIHGVSNRDATLKNPVA